MCLITYRTYGSGEGIGGGRLARGLEGIATAQNKSVEQLVVERLRSFLERPTSPRSLLQTIQALSHPSPAAVDDLDGAIAAWRLPVRRYDEFDGWPTDWHSCSKPMPSAN
jgi:hypothetical protein